MFIRRGAPGGRRGDLFRDGRGASRSSSESAANVGTQSASPRLRPTGDSDGVENEESDASENAELLLIVRCKDARPIGLIESAANWSIDVGD